MWVISLGASEVLSSLEKWKPLGLKAKAPVREEISI
jgi:hypothetical protein